MMFLKNLIYVSTARLACLVGLVSAGAVLRWRRIFNIITTFPERTSRELVGVALVPQIIQFVLHSLRLTTSSSS